MDFLIAQMTFTLDTNGIITTVFSSLILAQIALITRSNYILNRIVDQIGTNHPPEGILGRLTKAELELYDMREWAIRKGYDRRNNPPDIPHS